MTITADTSLDSILDVDKVTAYLNKGCGKIENELNNRIDDIEAELQRGLGADSYSDGGTTPLYDSAIRTREQQEYTLSIFNNFKADVLTLANSKRQEELQELYEAVEKKVKGLQASIDSIEVNTAQYNQSCGAMGGDPKTYSEWDSNYDTYVTSCNEYKQKLNDIKVAQGVI